jgi:hypothetical protein
MSCAFLLNPDRGNTCPIVGICQRPQPPTWDVAVSRYRFFRASAQSVYLKGRLSRRAGREGILPRLYRCILLALKKTVYTSVRKGLWIYLIVNIEKLLAINNKSSGIKSDGNAFGSNQ